MSQRTTPRRNRIARAASADSLEIDETLLLAGLRAGDRAAYESLVRHYGGRLLVVARRFLHCEADCHDALQDAFLSAFQSIGSFHGQATLGTWLHRIVVNACLMKLRSQSRRPAVSIEELLPKFDDSGHHAAPIVCRGEQPASRALSRELRERVRAAIDRLPDAYRRIVLLRDIEEIDTDEAAALLGVSTAVVKTRLHRARQALRTLLEQDFAGADDADASSNAGDFAASNN